MKHVTGNNGKGREQPFLKFCVQARLPLQMFHVPHSGPVEVWQMRGVKGHHHHHPLGPYKVSQVQSSQCQIPEK